MGTNNDKITGKEGIGYIPRKREKTRAYVMYFLLFILAGTIAGTFILIWYGKYSDVFIQTVLPSLTTLIGSALGFYFGGREREEAEEALTGSAITGATPPQSPPPPPVEKVS